MKYIILFTGTFFSVLLLTLIVPTVLAHVSFGVYTGTHAVAFVPQPGSPFVGETVEMNFFLRDLQGNFPTETFIVRVVIQETLADGSEQSVVELTPDVESPGIYAVRFRFDEGGQYRVEFLFNKIDEPDIIRDAVFDIEVRDIPVRDIPYSFMAALFIFAAFVSFWGGMAFARRRIS